jgi:GNAT superfamily N-acetyltransferase
MTDAPVITVPDAPGEAERLVVANALLAYNTKTVGPNNHQPLSILIHDPATGEPIGGIWGKTAFNWCFVELFVVPEQFRGQDIGSKVLAKAEEIARASVCGSIPTGFRRGASTRSRAMKCLAKSRTIRAAVRATS